MQLRNYQGQLTHDIYAAWQHARNVLAVLPTGGGKTVVFGHILANTTVPTVAIAHRQELVGQICLALAEFGVLHRIIAPKKTIRAIVTKEVRATGKSFYSPSATCAVAGVDTLIRRHGRLGSWQQQVGLWVQDEAHHVLAGNKWGKAANMFPNAYGLGVTATPIRADGKGLGRHADGLMDVMVEGPSMRTLIDEGFLTDYRIFAPPSDFQVDDLATTATGDFSHKQLRQRAKQSHIVGDVVDSYLKIAPGKLGLTFCVDVDTAQQAADNFNRAGVPAKMLCADTPDHERTAAIDAFRCGNLKQLVNVDLFGEGFDVPAIEVVSFARPTKSYAIFAQQFGRALRPLPGKTHAVIIDHVNNVRRHNGPPDVPKQWSLDAKDRRKRDVGFDGDKIITRTCGECSAVFEGWRDRCPYCGAEYIPAGRSLPEQVEGDLLELTPEALAALRAQVDEKDRDPVAVAAAMERAGAPNAAISGYLAKAKKRIGAQSMLRDSIALWAGYQKDLGRDDKETHRRFFLEFGADVLTVQTYNSKDSQALMLQVEQSIKELDNERVPKSQTG